MSYVNVYEVSETSNTSNRYTALHNEQWSALDAVLAAFAETPKRRSPSLDTVWRVRGWIGDSICHSRVYQRRAAALRNYRQAEAYYDRVTLERATVDPFVEVEVEPWR